MDPIINNSDASRHNNERNGTRYYERFHLNQFYNAVEDEQLYTDEYTNLLHTYNEFIVNGNAMFTRMEQALRANLDRSIVRQSFYYHRYTDIRRIRSPDDAIYHFTPAPVPAASQSAPVAAPAPRAAPAAAAASDSNHPRRSRVGDAVGRMLANYMTTENNRNERQNAGATTTATATATATRDTIQPSTNMYSMLYTYTQPIVFNRPNGTAAGGGEEISTIPTNDQIRCATLNTMYSNIISPVNTTCPISRDEFEDESEITMIRGCNHIFNRASLREWFVNHSTCPMCRNDIRNYREAPVIDSTTVNSLYSRIMDNSRNFTNMEINNISNDSVTFSYDLPPLYNRYTDEDIYRDLLNAVAGGQAAQAAAVRTSDTHRSDGDGDGDNGDPDDYMDMD